MMKIHGDYNDGHGAVVTMNGRVLDPASSLKVWNHSPDGFQWGYEGSGPAQLALAILLRAGLSPEQAVQLHQQFKRTFIAGLHQRSFDLEVDVQAWANHQQLSEDE